MNYSASIIDKKVYKFMGSCFYKLKTSDSWRGRKDVSCNFTKEEKEALNAMLFFILLIKAHKERGKEINWNGCIAYVIKRIIRKSLTWDAKPENMDDIRARVPDYDKKVEDYVKVHSYSNTNEQFIKFIDQLADSISDEEKEMFSVAKNHTNLVEFEQIKHVIFEEDIDSIKRRCDEDAQKHHTDEYVSLRLDALISRFSWSRNIVRWQGYGSNLACNILCHMLETAVFAWFMAIEMNRIFGEERFVPEKAFMVGLFHDVAEIWTDDVPSPCKDEIGRSHGEILRPITEDQERNALNQYFYVNFSDEVASYFKENIMLEELDDHEFHDFMKKADYFSADYEIWWNIVMGLRNFKLKRILDTSMSDMDRRTPAIFSLFREWREKLEQITFLEP